jgi:chloride channel 7
VFALIVVLAVVYYGPGAAGSGMPEIIAMLNGVHGGAVEQYQGMLIAGPGVAFTIVGGLCVGNLGTLGHIGSVLGRLLPYLPFDWLKPFRNDTDKRIFMAAGLAAGVAMAFGTPIGGTLFAYEVSNNTFWTFNMMWKSFFTSVFSMLTFGLLKQLNKGAVLSLSNASYLTFGNIYIPYSPYFDAVAAVFLGVIGGLMGAAFVWVNSNMAILRKKYVNTNAKKIAEVMLFSLVTTSVFYWLSALSAANPEDCLPVYGQSVNFYAFTCPPGTYNSQTTLFFNTGSAVIRTLMNQRLS